jgi:glycosyltransferase involved in cell wall biosynthesis
VVIAAKDAAATLAQTLDSICSQSRRPHETFVIDDGSTDGTGSLVAERFPNIRLLQQANAGPSIARNRGIAEANGRWIAFLDADDVWHPDKLAVQLDTAERHPSAVIVACDWIPPGSNPPKVRSNRGETVLSTHDLLVLNRFQTSTVLLRSDVARRTGGFDPSLDGTEDWDLWLRSSAYGTVVKVDSPLVCYRDLPGSYSKDGWRVYSSMLRLLDRHLATGSLNRRQQDELCAWHHLRFAVSFWLAGRPDLLRRVGANLRAEHLLGVVPTVRRLVPFLARRQLRRLRRLTRSTRT